MKRVKVVEIGPRDGFQNVKEFIPTETKLQIIDQLMAAGFQKIQVTSFVSPKAIPQLRDSRQVVEHCLEKYPKNKLFALVPNFTGARLAVEAGLTEISPVLSLSESHNMNNVKRTVAQSIEEMEKIRQAFPDVKITQDIATAFGCPFEGEMPVEALVELVGKLHALGIRAFTLCDTVGLAYPTLVEKVFQR